MQSDETETALLGIHGRVRPPTHGETMWISDANKSGQANHISNRLIGQHEGAGRLDDDLEVAQLRFARQLRLDLVRPDQVFADQRQAGSFSAQQLEVRFSDRPLATLRPFRQEEDHCPREPHGQDGDEEKRMPVPPLPILVLVVVVLSETDPLAAHFAALFGR